MEVTPGALSNAHLSLGAGDEVSNYGHSPPVPRGREHNSM